MGRVYERLIGLTKTCLKKVLGKATLTFQELVTVSTEIESAINDRPLTYIDYDRNMNVITPHHLIFGRNLNEKCFGENTEELDESQTRDSPLLSVMKKLYMRFENEYTLSLQECQQ